MINKAKILIVDDDALNRIILEKTLSDEHEIYLVTSGEEALAFVKHTQVDLIILDIMMPGMNGYDVLVELKESSLSHAIPIIFISANSSHEDEAKGLELGAMDYIVKPFCASIVKVRVRNQLLIKQKNDLLEMLASIDGLTEIPNRRYLDENLEREWRRSKRNNSSMCVLLIDIDHFKRYNDCYGHRAGDECLKTVAQTLAAQCERGSDFVARYGGEEFVAVLPETNKQGAIAFANKLRKAINDLNIEHNASLNASHITISIGIASSESSQAYTEKALLEEADSGLYNAKKLGRNQISAQ
ncbi:MULTISPECIES: diguanylate cyclase [unclassified Pseudoalteromonas]|uniref:GGDEF domain-containing response regulator n=1 Tax=unclassified Pseudoalteromonas TaxID=194690 RepID=UPI00097740BC|nr:MULTISPECIES: diguanylate cyclase [unclassified Pseudoalteromonas]QBJ63895.1 diguanylate cyclase response regulator [Pseudoalteromonas sp. DL-6]